MKKQKCTCDKNLGVMSPTCKVHKKEFGEALKWLEDRAKPPKKCCPCEELDGCVCKCHRDDIKRKEDVLPKPKKIKMVPKSFIKRCEAVQKEGWEDGVKLLINEWVFRLIKFGDLNLPKKYRAGYTLFECPELEPFIRSLLATQRHSILKGFVSKLEIDVCKNEEELHNALLYSIAKMIEKEKKKQRQEVEEIVENAKDDMSGTYDYDRIAEGVIEWLRTKEGRRR